MSMTAKLIDLTGKASGEAALPESVFGAKIRKQLLFDAVLMQQASARQGGAKAKERSEVRGGGRKPFKQKGTGNARQGSTRSPLMPGGGRIFGPKVRSYEYRMPAKARKEALRVALSQAQTAGRVFVVKNFTMEKPKIKTIIELLAKIKIGKALVVDTGNDVLHRSVRNLPNAKYLDECGLNVFDVLKYENVLFSSNALAQVEKRLAS